MQLKLQYSCFSYCNMNIFYNETQRKGIGMTCFFQIGGELDRCNAIKRAKDSSIVNTNLKGGCNKAHNMGRLKRVYKLGMALFNEFQSEHRPSLQLIALQGPADHPRPLLLFSRRVFPVNQMRIRKSVLDSSGLTICISRRTTN